MNQQEDILIEEETKDQGLAALSQFKQESNRAQSQEIVIKITSTETVVEGVTKYTLYIIYTQDVEGSNTVKRRFNDFIAFRQALVLRWPGCYIPPLPPKQAVGNLDQNFINTRQAQLLKFLQELSEQPAVWYGEEGQQFLRLNGNDIERYFLSLTRLPTDELIKKYEKNFRELQNFEINLELLNSIQKFQQFVNRALPMLENFKTIYKNLSKARAQHNDQYLTFISYMLPEYEKTNLKEYCYGDQQLQVFHNRESEKLQLLTEKLREFFNRNEFNSLLTAVREEQREIQAFQEAIQQREYYEQIRRDAVTRAKELNIDLQELIAGKTTLWSILAYFSSSSKYEAVPRMQLKIDQVNKEIEQLTFFCDILTVLIGHVQIKRFREKKQKQYLQVMHQVAKFELELNQIGVEYWSHVLTQTDLNKAEQG